MKEAVVFYLWGKKNAGDMAICLGTISLLEDLGYNITFVSRFSSDQEDYNDSKNFINHYHPNVKVVPGLFTLDRNSSKFKKSVSYLKGINKIITPNKDKQLSELISKADVVFLNGGNLLRGKNITDYARLTALFYPFQVAKRLNKPMICLPQSTADSNKLGVRIIQKNLVEFNKVFIRESTSYSVLSQKIKEVPFVKSTDACFFIKDVPNALEEYKQKYASTIEVSKKNVAIVLRSTTIGDIGEFDNRKKEKLANQIVLFIKEFSNHYNFHFVVQTKKDKDFTEYVMSQVEKNTTINIIEEYDAYILREIYTNMHFVLAMRLHAAILSMTAKTPVLGYFENEWGLKNPGIMNDVGMPWTTKGADLIEKSKEIDANREIYVEKITSFIKKEKDVLESNFKNI